MNPTLNTRAAKPCGRERGSALLIALISLMFVMVLGAGVLSLTLSGVRLTDRAKRSTSAFNIAESGAELAMRWLKDQPSPPSGLSPFNPFGGAQALGNGTYNVTITPDAANAGAPLKRYVIVVNGLVGGRTEKVEIVARQQSFGKFAYFTDSETSSITGGPVWFFSGDRIRGPAHSNNAGDSDFRVSWGGGGGPIFEGPVTAAGDQMVYAPRGPASEAEYSQVYQTGSTGYQLNVDEIPLPSSSDVQKVAAWGSGTGFPSTNGVYTNANGGIFVQGDADVQLLVDGSGNQQFKITQGANVTTVTIDKINNTTKRSTNGGPVTTIPSAGTGVLYAQGNINSLYGTVADNKMSGGTILARNSFTIATDVNAGKNITVTEDLTYQSAPNPDLPTTDMANLKPGTLGLMARNVRVGSSAPTNLEINAVILAGGLTTADGSFYVENYNSKKPTGSLKVVGGIIQKARGPVGTLSGGKLNTGYAKDYYYDPRLADNPPPFFPTTGSYDRTSWRRLPG